MNFNLALSAKQLELGMVKRNARFALKNHAQSRIQHKEEVGSGDVGLPKSKNSTTTEAQSKAKKEDEEAEEGGRNWPIVPEGGFAEKVNDKENATEKPTAAVVNPARAHARQLLAQRRAAAADVGERAENGGGQAKRPIQPQERLALLA